MRWWHGALAICSALAGCSGKEQAQRRVESDAELQAQDERAFDMSPNVQLPELRRKLVELGVRETAIQTTMDDSGIEVFKLALEQPDFDRLDKVALAKLLLDSRYRFDLSDPRQVQTLANYAVSEDADRRKLRYWKELEDNGELEIFPRYHKGDDIAEYARSLERYCGYAPGEALNVIDGQWLEYRHSMVDRATQELGSGTLASFKCVVRIVYATELQPRFIGNRGISVNQSH